jgi:hypothetical protein
MFKLFARKQPVVPAPVTATAFGAYGFVTHLMVCDDQWKALCGANMVKSGHEVNVDEIIRSIPRQHNSFFFCADCVNRYTGVPQIDILLHRRPL